MNTDQIRYYSERAKEYEKIYSKPERQENLLLVSDYLQDQFTSKQVLEIACGTGYWTERISRTAGSVYASDINPSVIEIAKTKKYKCQVEFYTEDIFTMNSFDKTFDAGFAGFIWSHIPKRELELFMVRFTSAIRKNGNVIIIDNEYVDGNSTPLEATDEFGNTYQIRQLENGSQHKVLKNYPADAELKNIIEPFASKIEIRRLDYYWILSFINK